MIRCVSYPPAFSLIFISDNSISVSTSLSPPPPLPHPRKRIYSEHPTALPLRLRRLPITVADRNKSVLETFRIRFRPPADPAARTSHVVVAAACDYDTAAARVVRPTRKLDLLTFRHHRSSVGRHVRYTSGN